MLAKNTQAADHLTLVQFNAQLLNEFLHFFLLEVHDGIDQLKQGM